MKLINFQITHLTKHLIGTRSFQFYVKKRSWEKVLSISAFFHSSFMRAHSDRIMNWLIHNGTIYSHESTNSGCGPTLNSFFIMFLASRCACASCALIIYFYFFRNKNSSRSASKHYFRSRFQIKIFLNI
jgi:hypothetical protein